MYAKFSKEKPVLSKLRHDVSSKLALGVPLTFDFLKEQYKEYRSPKDKISRLTIDGDLIRLKKGLYLPVSDNTREFQTLALIANQMLGPSYVSLETALSYYGLIPEKVCSIRSVTTKRSKKFTNPLGQFEYLSAKNNYFSIGIKQVMLNDISFLIASPEKAICDMIVMTASIKIQSAKAMREYIEEDMRIDIDEFNLQADKPSTCSQPDMSIFDKVLETGLKRREIGFLKEYFNNAK